MNNSPSSIHIYLDTRQKNIGGSNSDFSFTLPNSELRGHLLGLSVESCTIPVLEYPINSNNNIVYFRENGGGILTATIPPNNYTGSELAETLKSIMDTAGTLTYTITYDDQSKKLDFLVGLPDTFELLEGENNSLYVLGFSEATSSLTAHVSTHPVRLDGSEYYDLEILGVQHDNIHSNNNSSTMARIPLLERFSGISYYVNPDNSSFITVNHDLFYRIRIRLLRPDGKLADLPDTAYVNLVLRCISL